jgi:two-component system sensor histidine kinase YesM
MFKSIRMKFILSFVIVVAPLVGLLFYINLYSMKMVRTEAINTYNNLMNVYISGIDRSLEKTNEYLDKLSLDNPYIDALALNEYGSTDYIYTKYEVLQSFKEILGYNPHVDTVFAYVKSNGDFISTDPYFGGPPEQAFGRQDTLLRAMEGERFYTWKAFQLRDSSALINIIPINENVYIGAWINAQNLIGPFELMDLGEQGEALLVSKQYEPLTQVGLSKALFNSEDRPNAEFWENNQFIRNPAQDITYLKVSKPSNWADFTLMVLIPEEKLLQKLPFFQQLFYIISVVVAFVLILYALSLRYILTKPLGKIIQGMKRLENGIINTRISPVRSAEFNVLINAFNKMVSEISNLKINIYEEKIKTQQAEYKHLQAQINPHFYLNSLNIVYNLAALREYEGVQKLVLHISEYFRFIMRTDKELVKISEEIHHIRNYLEIQKLRFPDQLRIDLEVPEELADCSIPPLIIQPFVENSIIHGFTRRTDSFEIRVKVSGDAISQDRPSFFDVTITDNGKGFPAPVLEALQSGAYFEKGHEGHLGIWNVCRRIKMRYSEAAKVSFENGEQGTIVRLRLPTSELVLKKGDADHVQLTRG